MNIFELHRLGEPLRLQLADPIDRAFSSRINAA
jgi:hypothetical protein